MSEVFVDVASHAVNLEIRERKVGRAPTAEGVSRPPVIRHQKLDDANLIEVGVVRVKARREATLVP